MKHIVEEIQGKRIVVIGDIMLDHYINGTSTRLSPEAPVPVVVAEKDSFVAGGAANVAVNLASMGIEVELCGIMGNDFYGNVLCSILNTTNVNYDNSFIKKQATTTVKTRVVAINHQICRIDRESNFYLYDLSNNEVLNKIINKVKYADAVIISDYAKGSINETLLEKLTAITREYNVFSLLDPKPKNRIKIGNVDLLKPNRSEALELAGMPLETHAKFPIEEVCQKIWQRFKPRYLIITLGAEGMLLSEAGQIKKIIPTTAKSIFDVTGAGDTTMAALAAAISAGIPIEEAMVFANYCAGIVVGKHGTAYVTIEEIMNHAILEENRVRNTILT